MKHHLLSFVLATAIISVGALTTSTVYAQEPAQEQVFHPEPKFDRAQVHKKMAEKIAKELNLTDEQQAQAEKIREQGRKDIEPLVNEMKALREKMDVKRRANMQEFEKILTPEQKTKFDELKKNGPRHHKKHHHHVRPRSHHLSQEMNQAESSDLN